ncbi:MAG: aminopeptidase [Eubacteriales bacterium]|nr:aminopeptidase [Eubacteriales bacterium]MDD4512456.1 aminopeptidase [Eubacteriales bacterium]
MKDSRIEKLSKNLVEYSCEVKPGDKVLIENFGVQREFVCELVKAVSEAGGIPLVQLYDTDVQAQMLKCATEEQLNLMAKYDVERMKDCQCYIGIRAGDNQYAQGDVPADKLAMYGKLYSRVVHSNERIRNTRWAVLRYPTPSMAQSAHMSTPAFEDFYFNVCNLDYAKMNKAMDKLVARMERTDRVHITGKGTDLSFSIKGQPAIKCDGKLNIPDGEVFSAPIKNSVNGVLQYNTPSLYQGVNFSNIRLVFKDGKIVEATANDTERVNKVFDTDEGARYIGEFSLGVNPYIHEAILDTLFDEKIAGSIHFTPGNCYDECPNGNHSAIHWDLVYIQTPEYGGGEIWFDDELIRKDGRFVSEELLCLNPENLK